MEVEEKIDEMQKYIPCLKLLIGNLEKNPAKEEQVKKMKYLLEMLVNKDSSIKLETLVRCEGILQKIYGKEQMLSSSVENDSRKGETEVQNENKNQETSNSQSVSDSNQPKLVNGSSSETTGINESHSSNLTKTTGNESEKQPIVKNDDDKGGGDSVLIVDSTNSKSERSSHKMEGSNNGKEIADHKLQVDQTDSTNSSGLIIHKAESLNCNTPRNESKSNELEDTSSKPLQLENHGKSNDSIKNSGVNHMEIEDDEPKVVNEPTGDGDCDMDIDEELTKSIISKALCGNQTSESQKKEPSAENKEIKSGDGSKAVPTSSPTTTSTPSSKSNFVDLTSDDSNDETPKTPTARSLPPQQKVTPKSVNNQVEKINIQPKIPSEKPAVVYQTKKMNEMNNSQTQTQNKVSTSTPAATSDPAKVVKTTPTNAETEPKKNIMTIDLLDSDSDDEGKSNSKSKSSTPDGKVQMPTPKMLGDKPMFTIASVQSISTLQQHQEKRREVEKELYSIVKSIQYTTHHTVPQKHNAAVLAYLERFIKDLMFEKNRVNLCLQKLLKTLEPEKYKQVKKIIQTYCSEPVNDPNLPTPSPFCHRIKVYPEKLQFVMRQMFFFNTGISVLGYKVFALSKNNQIPNGVVKSPTPSPGKDAKKSPQIPVGPNIINQKPNIINQKPQLGRPVLPKPTPLMQRSISSPAGKPSPITTPPTTSSSESNLLAPMKTQSSPIQPMPKPKRRKHDSDDDDDDENYVPQGYFSESDEPTEESSDTPRRTSLQRASKIRCQEYLELERSIDDETYIRATEATIARALKREGRPKPTGSQPPVKKYKPAPGLKKKKPSQIEDDGDSKASQDSSETREREDDTEDSQPAKKRPRKADKKNSDGMEDMDQEDEEDEEPAPELDTTVENTAKNVTRAYHCRSKFLDKCLICHEKTIKKCAISHYVNSHRDREVFISRLNKGDILKMQSETMCFAFPSSNAKSSAYVAYCIFCRQEQCLSMRNWYEHYTRHTGEYLYECSQCKARRSQRQQINRHVNIECTKKGSSMVVLKEVDPDIIRIDACVCMLCNYVQLDFERLVRHLQNEHEFPGAINELPEGTYQVLNLLRIEQNYYESSKYDDSMGGMANEIEETIPEDDMSYMICNMLASTNDQVPSDHFLAGDALANDETMVGQVATDSLVAADAVNDQTAIEPTSDPLQSDDILADSESKPNDERPQTPEMIVPDELIVPTVIVKTDEDEDDLPSTEADTNIEKTSGDVDSELIEATSDQKDVEIQEQPELTDHDKGSQHSMEALQMEDSTESTPDEMESTVQDQSSTENETQDKSNQDTTSSSAADTKDEGSKLNELNTDSTILEEDPLDTSSHAAEKPKSLLSELNSIDDLTKSATESIFQRVSDSLINSVYGAVEVATTVSDSTSELPDSNAVSSENTMDSEESGPQFLQPALSPIDPVLLTVHETIVPDLDGGNEFESIEHIDEKEEDRQVADAQVAVDIDDLILPESMENSLDAHEQAECITDELIIPECCDEMISSDKLDSGENGRTNEQEHEAEELPNAQEVEELAEAQKAEQLTAAQEAQSIEINEPAARIEDFEGVAEDSSVAQTTSEKADQSDLLTETRTAADPIDEPQTDSDQIDDPQVDSGSAANPESSTIHSQSNDSDEVKETNDEQESTAQEETSELQETIDETNDDQGSTAQEETSELQETIDETNDDQESTAQEEASELQETIDETNINEPIANETDENVQESSVNASPKVDKAADENCTENLAPEIVNESSVVASPEADKCVNEKSTENSPPSADDASQEVDNKASDEPCAENPSPETVNQTTNEMQESSSDDIAPLEKSAE